MRTKLKLNRWKFHINYSGKSRMWKMANNYSFNPDLLNWNCNFYCGFLFCLVVEFFLIKIFEMMYDWLILGKLIKFKGYMPEVKNCWFFNYVRWLVIWLIKSIGINYQILMPEGLCDFSQIYLKTESHSHEKLPQNFFFTIFPQ